MGPQINVSLSSPPRCSGPRCKKPVASSHEGIFIVCAHAFLAFCSPSCHNGYQEGVLERRRVGETIGRENLLMNSPSRTGG
jgi:hypothetical protein